MNSKFNLRMDTIRAFFSKNQGTFFDFQKRAGEASPLFPTVVVRLLLSVFLLVCKSFCVSFCLSIYISLPAFVPAYPPICLSAFLPVCLSFFLSICLSVCLSVGLCISLATTWNKFFNCKCIVCCRIYWNYHS